MASPVEFDGQITVFGPPPGKEEEIGSLPVFGNGVSVVSCWQFTEAEWEQVKANDYKVFLSIMSGGVVLPCFVGSEQQIAAVVSDTGKVWR